MEQTLENKVARASAMLRTATDEWRAQVGRARITVARGRGALPDPEAMEGGHPAALRGDGEEGFVDLEHSAPMR
jgi:hypothetical protein